MFPTPLTCLEEYMLCDDRPAHPMTVALRLRFSGYLDRSAWETALQTVLQRHPLLRATVGRAGRRLQWREDPQWRPPVVWNATTNPFGFPNMEYIDLTREPGTRVWVVDRGGAHDAIIQVHHACTDGLGSARMLEDLLVSYSEQIAGSGPTSLVELDADSFRRRGAPGLTVGRFLTRLHRQALGLAGAREFLTRSPVPLGPSTELLDPAVPPPHFPRPCRVVLSQNCTHRLIAAAKSLQVTLNDLLVRDLFLTVTQWRMERRIGTDRDWLRFSIPMNLRLAQDGRMPMANSVSSVFLDRRPMDCHEPDSLLRGISAQMQLIKRNELQYTFILSLGLTRLLPGGLAARTQARQCELSSYFSNVGPILNRTPLPHRDGHLVCGNVELTETDLVIPRRPFVDASFCVYTYAGRLNVLMHPDERSYPDEHWTALLSEFVQRLDQTAATHEEAGTTVRSA